MKPAELDRRHVYVTPLGRRCVLRVQPEARERVTWFSFVYLGVKGGFAFTAENLRLLKREVVR